MGLLTMGLGNDGSGLNLVLSAEIQEESVEITPIIGVEIEAISHTIEVDIDIKKVNISTGEMSEFEDRKSVV